nr:hypothetical protein [Candidatus Njordarchaeota archaeon]
MKGSGFTVTILFSNVIRGFQTKVWGVLNTPMFLLHFATILSTAAGVVALDVAERHAHKIAYKECL